MKIRIGIVILILGCIGLVIALVSFKKTAAETQRQDAEKIGTLSNKWVKTSADLEDQRQVAALLEKDIAAQKKALEELTNNFSQVSADLTKTEASLQSAQAEVAKRDARIAELQSQNQALDQRAVDLNSAITNLTSKIEDTQRKLAASEGDKAFLETELKRLMAEKAELERQFNDLTILRAQVSKLKDELSIARRLDWIRQGIFSFSDQKGAQKLMQGINPPRGQQPVRGTNYDLNVEVSADGSVRVIPPATNAVPATNAPPK